MTFDQAMAAYEEAHPVGTIADSFPFTPGGEASSSPATASPDAETADLSTPADDCSREPRVNMPKRRWTHVRVPVGLAERLAALAGEMLIAHGQGRLTLPNSMAEYVPAWFAIENALNEQEARRERSRRPRRAK